MAYAFDKIEKLLGNGGEAGQGGFGLTSSTAGDISPLSGTSTAPQSANYSSQPSTSAAQKSILKSNAGRTASPINLGQVQDRISGASSGLKKEADDYVAGAAAPYSLTGVPTQQHITDYAKSGSTQKKGLKPYPGSGPAAYNYSKYSTAQAPAPMDWLQMATTAPMAPSPINFKTNTNIEDVDLLGSDAGIRQLFKRGGGARYTPGMAALDTSILRGSGDFTTQAADVLGSYGALQKEKTDIGDNAQKAGHAAAGAAQGQFRSKVMDLAHGSLSDMTEEQKNEAKNAVKGFTDFTQQSDVIRGRLKASNPDMADYIDSMSSEDLNALITESTTPGEAGSTDWKDYLDEGEAAAFNRIYRLLGQGDIAVKGNRGGKDASLDLPGLGRKVKERRQKRLQ